MLGDLLIFCCCDVKFYFCEFCKEFGWYFSFFRFYLVFYCKIRSFFKYGIYIFRFLLIIEVIKFSNIVKKKINVKIFLF